MRIVPELFIAIATNTPAGVFASEQFSTDQKWKIERVPSGSDSAAPIVATAGWNTRELRALLVAKKHVVVLEPHLALAAEWDDLHQLASANGVSLTGYSLAPDDGDAAMALSAFKSDRAQLGSLVSVRWTDSRWSGWGNTASRSSGAIDPILAGADMAESSIRSLWRHRLFPIVRTAVQLVDTEFKSINVWPHPPCAAGAALLVVLQTPDGVVLQLDLRHRAFVRYHSGWLLEGTTGGYHAGKRYWHASDGEVLDEPIPFPPVWSLPEAVADSLDRWAEGSSRGECGALLVPTLRVLDQILDGSVASPPLGHP